MLSFHAPLTSWIKSLPLIAVMPCSEKRCSRASVPSPAEGTCWLLKERRTAAWIESPDRGEAEGERNDQDSCEWYLD